LQQEAVPSAAKAALTSEWDGTAEAVPLKEALLSCRGLFLFPSSILSSRLVSPGGVLLAVSGFNIWG
jgi:hypothetical protein